MRGLEALNITGQQYGVVLTPLVLSRLPPDLSLEWAREGELHESDLGFLQDFLQRELDRRERSQTFAMAHVRPLLWHHKDCCHKETRGAARSKGVLSLSAVRQGTLIQRLSGCTQSVHQPSSQSEPVLHRYCELISLVRIFSRVSISSSLSTYCSFL